MVFVEFPIGFRLFSEEVINEVQQRSQCGVGNEISRTTC